MVYMALCEDLVTNIALRFACAKFATRLSPRAIYFIQTGGSALSNTYKLQFVSLLPFCNNLKMEGNTMVQWINIHWNKGFITLM